MGPHGAVYQKHRAIIRLLDERGLRRGRLAKALEQLYIWDYAFSFSNDRWSSDQIDHVFSRASSIALFKTGEAAGAGRPSPWTGPWMKRVHNFFDKPGSMDQTYMYIGLTSYLEALRSPLQTILGAGDTPPIYVFAFSLNEGKLTVEILR